MNTLIFRYKNENLYNIFLNKLKINNWNIY